MKISLKTRIMIIFVVFVSVPLITLGIISTIKTSQSMQSFTEQQLKEYTSQTAKAVNQTIDSVNKYLLAVSQNPQLTSAANGDKNAAVEVYKYLSDMQKKNSNEIEMFMVTDASGTGIVSSEKDKIDDVDLSDREYVQNALKGSSAQSEVILSKETNKPVIAIAYPLILNNKVVGTLVGTIEFDNISKHASEIKVGKNGYAYMIDKNGQFIYHPSTEKILKDNIDSINSSDLKALVVKMKAGKTDQGYYTYNGVRKFVVFTPANKWVVAVTADYNEYMSSALTIKSTTIKIIVIAIILSLLIIYLLTTFGIINPIKRLEKLMTKAGDGDLTVRANIKTKDEIQTLGEYLNQMVEHQENIIKHVRKGAEELLASSEELSASAEEISSSTEQIASNIQQVASSAEQQNNSIISTSEVLVQLSSLIQIAQKKALTAKGNSQNTMDTAQQGRTKVKETVMAIEDINRVSDETADILKALNELSKKVSGIIDTINSISAQTNMLALNAAIEAARAGEHGRGFTVVADEVRKLSEQTNVGANEISTLVNEMVIQIEKAVESMNSSKQTVENGVIIVNETDQSFVSIISAVEQIVKDINQIVDVTKDEVASSDQIVKLIDSVASITETTTASSQEVAVAAEEQTSVIQNIAASAEQNSAMAGSLNNLVEKFIV